MAKRNLMAVIGAASVMAATSSGTLGSDLEAFEALFTQTLTLQLEATLQQYNQVLNQFRLQMAQISIQARLEFRYEHVVRQQTQQNG